MAKEIVQDGNLTATQERTSRPPVVHLNIRDARARLSGIVNDMESSQSVYTVGRRNNPTAMLTSYARFEPFLDGDYKSRLAFMIVENLLRGAPKHIRNPQIEELRNLSKEDLLWLARVEKLPLDEYTEGVLKENLSDLRILDRLLKRHQIALAIASAQKEGLYEAAEDLTGRVNLESETEDASQGIG
ncbi:MAG: hypothetical protein QNJ97_18565 [Myxococcota bacterium]|nr:hypothetical protein [Myxococcota bacterium]